MLAILPFQNLSNDPGQEYFSDGLTEETITDLGQLSPEHLGVIARTTAMAYKHTDKTVGQIGHELSVDYILEASVRREGGKARISAQLIRVSDQTHLWARNYDRELKDVIEVQNDLGRAIAEQVQAHLTPQREIVLSGTHTVNPDAYDAYLRGLQGWNQRSREGFLQAITNFIRATELDSNYAPAFAGLARVYSLAPIFAGIPPSEAAPKALASANRALSLDEALSDAHSALAFVRAHYQYDWPSAEREFHRAIELDPNNVNGHFFYSNSYLSPFGRHEEAIAEMKKAMALDPLSTRIQSFAGRTLIWARHYDEALTQFQKVNESDPNFALNHQRLAQLYALLAKYENAIAEETKARMLAGEKPQWVLTKMDIVRRAVTARGAKGYWEAELELSREGQSPPESYSRPFGLAMIYSHLEDKDRAFANLEIACAERDTQMTEIAIEPHFDPLRSDPRFADLERRVGIRGR
jgi:TolB-like protein